MTEALVFCYMGVRVPRDILRRAWRWREVRPNYLREYAEYHLKLLTT